jgi:ubiquinone/menaquinone biosynthesis C-methylase UbiE
VTLRDAWDGEAANWIEWARAPGHDSYWRFHRDEFLKLLPAPGRLTVDLGCGEGRLPRDLKARGHRIVGIDGSPALVAAAREADPDGDYRVADSAAVPLGDASADLVVAFMTLQDFDDMEAAVLEACRILEPGGRFCVAIVHPINSGGAFVSHDPTAEFVIGKSYFEHRRESELFEREGHTLTFNSEHRPLETYFAALEQAGFLVERLREVPDTTAAPGDRWARIPLFVHIRALRP